MVPLISDAQFNTIGLIVISFIGIVPATLAAIWSRQGRSNSADALHEVKSNGGMSDPDPTLKDYLHFVGENIEVLSRRLNAIEDTLDDHITHSKVMDSALAQVFLTVKPDIDFKERDNFP